MVKNFNLQKKIPFTAAVFLIFAAAQISFCFINNTQQEEQQTVVAEGKVNLLKLLDIDPSEESVEFILNHMQIQQQELITEQPHQKTTYLSEMTKKDYEILIEMLFSVDEDIELFLRKDKKEKKKLHQLAKAIEEALLSGNKIYVYDSSSTGWTAKTIESVFWRPFWKKVKQEKKIWEKIEKNLSENIEEILIGETTGGDIALLSPVDPLEELEIMGKLQLIESNIGSKDVVIGVSENGEEPAVIGTMVSALDQKKNDKNLSLPSPKNIIFFIYNNPDDKLMPFDLSRKVLQEPKITKINLTTGPQAVAGHTSMQASTLNTFVLGNVIQTAIDSALRRFLSEREMEKIGFEVPLNLDKRLEKFSDLLNKLNKCAPDLADLSRLESQTYNAGHVTTYMAGKGFFTTFVYSISKKRFFNLYPFDTINEKNPKSKLQIWCPVETPEEAWTSLLGRPFRPNDWNFYIKTLNELIENQELKTPALDIIETIKTDPQNLYDFSYGNFNLVNRAPKAADLGVLIIMSLEEDNLENKNSPFIRFLELFQGRGAYTAVIFLSEERKKEYEKALELISRLQPKGPFIHIWIEDTSDPLKINQQTALKMLLDAHSAAVMAGTGNIIGNTPSETGICTFKQIDRATSLIQNYVNQTLRHPQWVKKYGVHNPINYGEANAVLFDSLKYLKNISNPEIGKPFGVVTLSTIRILESLRSRQSVSLEETSKIAKEKRLAQYLADIEQSF